MLHPLKQGFLLLCIASLLALNETSAQSVSTTGNGSGYNFSHQDSEKKLKIESNGEIAISNDEKSISPISPGGYLKIEKTTFGNSRSVVINNNGNGLEYEYKEGGRVKAFEPDGKAWLAEMLPELMNTTALGASGRVNSRYASGGSKAVLSLVDNLKGDHVKATYLRLLTKKDLKPKEVTATIDKTISQISSDHYQLEVYENIPPTYFNDLSQLSRAVEALDSDHFKTELLKPIFKTNVIDGNGQKAIQLIQMVDSDHFKTEITKTIPFSSLTDNELKFLVAELVPTIGSDHFKNEVLKTVVDKGDMDENRLLILLDGVDTIDSDHIKSEILRYICKKQGSEKIKAKIREKAKSGIDSSHFLGEVMKCAG